jgi:hypothetical protein
MRGATPPAPTMQHQIAQDAQAMKPVTFNIARGQFDFVQVHAIIVFVERFRLGAPSSRR